MPRANSICNKQGCADIATQGSYCDAHKLPAWQKKTPRKAIPGWSRIRQHILYRDQHTCQLCGAPATEIDHIIPLSQGGPSKPANLQALCTPCNQQKNIRERRGTHPPTGQGGGGS